MGVTDAHLVLTVGYCDKCPKCGAPMVKFDLCQDGHGVFAPFPGPQTTFLTSTAREVLFGGAAGPGKTFASVLLPLRYIQHYRLSVLVLRRQTTDLVELKELSRRIYSKMGGRMTQSGAGFTWRFDGGARILFSHCNTVDDAHGYDGHEFQIIIFDELVQFEKKQYDAIKARLRGSVEGLPRWIRGSTNPPDDGQGEWVFEHWGAWLNPDFVAKGLEKRLDERGQPAPPLAPCQVAWIVKSDDAEKVDVYIVDEAVADDWNAAPERTIDNNYALSRQFIPALAKDNPALMENDKEYVRGFADMDPVRRAQLADGNWLIRPAPGMYFQRSWCEFVSGIPAGVIMIRAWDRAATAEADGSDPDHTAGVLLAVDQDATVFVVDVIRMRGSPGDVAKMIKATCVLDGMKVKCLMNIDPAQAGKSEFHHLTTYLAGHNIDGMRETGDKRTRFSPFSAYAKLGKVKIVLGAWNKAYVQELESFPTKGVHDDQVDATSSAFAFLFDIGHGAS